MFSLAQQDDFFSGSPQDRLWIGRSRSIAPAAVAVPFKYDDLRFVMLFSHPADYLGDEDDVLAYSQVWADGFSPHRTARLVKFLRAEAIDDIYTPSAWPLINRNGIFELGTVLRDAWLQHQRAVPSTDQYFYMATDPSLAKFYERIFVKSRGAGILSNFEPILEPLGDFHGYQKKA